MCFSSCDWLASWTEFNTKNLGQGELAFPSPAAFLLDSHSDRRVILLAGRLRNLPLKGCLNKCTRDRTGAVRVEFEEY